MKTTSQINKRKALSTAFRTYREIYIPAIATKFQCDIFERMETPRYFVIRIFAEGHGLQIVRMRLTWMNRWRVSGASIHRDLENEIAIVLDEIG